MERKKKETINIKRKAGTYLCGEIKKRYNRINMKENIGSYYTWRERKRRQKYRIQYGRSERRVEKVGIFILYNR